MQLEMACISGKQDCGALHKISTDTVPKREAKRIVLAVVDGWSLWRSSWAVFHHHHHQHHHHHPQSNDVRLP